MLCRIYQEDRKKTYKIKTEVCCIKCSVQTDYPFTIKKSLFIPFLYSKRIIRLNGTFYTTDPRMPRLHFGNERGDSRLGGDLEIFVISFYNDFIQSLDTEAKALKRKLGYISTLCAIECLDTLKIMAIMHQIDTIFLDGRDGIYNLVRSGTRFTNLLRINIYI